MRRVLNEYWLQQDDIRPRTRHQLGGSGDHATDKFSGSESQPERDRLRDLRDHLGHRNRFVFGSGGQHERQDYQGRHDNVYYTAEDDYELFDEEGDITIMPNETHSGPLFGHGGRAIPIDPDSFMNYYNNTPRKSKRDRDSTEDVESRQSKISRRSTSRSAAQSVGPSIPSTKAPTEAVSRASREGSMIPMDEPDPQGASRTTGGVFRGRAAGNHFNFADAGKSLFLYTLSAHLVFSVLFRCYGCGS